VDSAWREEPVDGIAEREKTIRLGIYPETNGAKRERAMRLGRYSFFLLTRNSRNTHLTSLIYLVPVNCS